MKEKELSSNESTNNLNHNNEQRVRKVLKILRNNMDNRYYIYVKNNDIIVNFIAKNIVSYKDLKSFLDLIQYMYYEKISKEQFLDNLCSMLGTYFEKESSLYLDEYIKCRKILFKNNINSLKLLKYEDSKYFQMFATKAIKHNCTERIFEILCVDSNKSYKKNSKLMSIICNLDYQNMVIDMSSKEFTLLMQALIYKTNNDILELLYTLLENKL